MVAKLISIQIVDGGKTAEAKHHHAAPGMIIQDVLQIVHKTILVSKAGRIIQIVLMLCNDRAQV